MDDTSRPSAASSLLRALRVQQGDSSAHALTTVEHPQPTLKKTAAAEPKQGATDSPIMSAVSQLVQLFSGDNRKTLTTIADLGPMVRKSRKSMKMNQADFAAHAGVGRRFVSELESGKPSLEFEKVLACLSAAGIDLMAIRRQR